MDGVEVGCLCDYLAAIHAGSVQRHRQHVQLVNITVLQLPKKNLEKMGTAPFKTATFSYSYHQHCTAVKYARYKKRYIHLTNITLELH